MEGMSNVGGVNSSESASQSNSEGNGVNSDSSAQFNGQDLDTAMGGGTEQLGQDLQSGDSLKEGNAMNDLGAKITEAVNKALEDILGKGGEEAGGGEAPAGGSSGGGSPAGGSGGAESGGGAEKSSMIDEILKKLEEAGVITAEQADKLKQSLGEQGGAESGADSGMQQEEAVA
jgi:hypothetical protein